MNTDQRNRGRIEIGRFVGSDDHGRSQGFFAVNLSNGGMSVLRIPGQESQLEQGLDGDFAWVTIPLPDRGNALQAVAEVVHRRDYGPLERVGLRFRYMSPADRRMLDDYLAAAA